MSHKEIKGKLNSCTKTFQIVDRTIISFSYESENCIGKWLLRGQTWVLYVESNKKEEIQIKAIG